MQIDRLKRSAAVGPVFTLLVFLTVVVAFAVPVLTERIREMRA